MSQDENEMQEAENKGKREVLICLLQLEKEKEPKGPAWFPQILLTDLR